MWFGFVVVAIIITTIIIIIIIISIISNIIIRCAAQQHAERRGMNEAAAPGIHRISMKMSIQSKKKDFINTTVGGALEAFNPRVS